MAEKTAKVIRISRKLSLVGHKGFQELVNKVCDEMRTLVEEECLCSSWAGRSFEYDHYTISVMMYESKSPEVSVVHDDDHRSPLVEKAIEESLPEWYDIYQYMKEAEKEEREYNDNLWRNCRYM